MGTVTCVVTGLTLSWVAALNQHLLHSSRVALAGGMGNWTALKEMRSYGRLLEEHCSEGEPLSPILLVKMGKQGWQRIVGDASPCQAAQCLCLQQRMEVLSPAREGGLPEAGTVTAWELGAHSPPVAETQHQLSHSPAQVGMGSVSATQGSPKGLGDPAGLTWETAGKVAREPLTQHHQHPATLAGMAAEAPWPSSSSSQSLFGTIPLVLECSPMHTSPSPVISGPSLPGAQQILQKAAQEPSVATPCHPIPHYSTFQWSRLVAGWIKTRAETLL